MAGINKEFIAEWVAELRTGNREQTVGTLHEVREDGTEAFCCLGVAEDMLCKRGIATRTFQESVEPSEINDEAVSARYGYTEGLDRWSPPETGILTQAAAEYIGIGRNPDVKLVDPNEPLDDGKAVKSILSLAELNDNGLSFSEIADLIESNYLEVN